MAPMFTPTAGEGTVATRTCKLFEAPRYFRMWTGPLKGEPAPLLRPVKAAKPAPPPPPPKPKPPVQGDLF